MSIKKILFFTAILASIFIINNLIHSIYTLWQKNHLIVRAKEDLEKEKEKNKQLKSRLETVSRPQFVEEEIRNKLFLAKPGEGIVILPTDVLKVSISGRKKLKDTKPNWQKWREIFF